MISCRRNKISKKTINSDDDFKTLGVVYKNCEQLIDLSKNLLSNMASFKKKLKLNK